MKRWAFLVVLLYVVILAVVLGAALLAGFWPESVPPVDEALENPFWGNGDMSVLGAIASMLVGVMALAQVALLVVPVRLAGGRPVTRRWIVWPVAAAVVLMLVMVAGMVAAVWETLTHTKGVDVGHYLVGLGAVGVVWLIWAFLFGFYTGGRAPKTFMSRLVRFLIAGSILEVLVAVPTHMLARVRNYCCAGYYTFWGLAAGLSVMLVAFGPGVFFLFARRWQWVRRKQTRRPKPIEPKGEDGGVPAHAE